MGCAISLGKPRRQRLRNELWEAAAWPPKSGGFAGVCARCWSGGALADALLHGNNLVNSWEAAENPFVNRILKEVLNSLGYSLSTELCKMSQMENKVTSVSTWVRALPATDLRMTSLIPKQVRFVPHHFLSPVQHLSIQNYLKVSSSGEKGGRKGPEIQEVWSKCIWAGEHFRMV